MRLRHTLAALALVASSLFAQIPQAWSSWRKTITPDGENQPQSLTWRWRKVLIGGKTNVPLEVEVRNAEAKSTSPERYTLTILYERAIEGTTYLQNVPRREMCYLNCTSAADAEGAACQWSGQSASEGVTGIRVIEARIAK